MSKILNANDMLEAVETCDAFDTPGIHTRVCALEDAQSDLADEMAKIAGIEHDRTDNQPGLGGLCSVFKGRSGQSAAARAIKAISEGDPGGEWDD